MEPAKTVSIVCPENLRAGYKNIPAAEYDPAVHVLFDREAGKAAEPGLRSDGPTVAEFVAAGYISRSTAEEVAAAVAAQQGTPGPVSIEIPADWKSLHWKQRVALAEKLNGDATLDPAAGQTQTEAADAVIAAALASRSAA
ncbi:hypothetical protein GGQ86_002983 [Xanthobacter flavus]|uniref:Uncharacterized protein n=1 Tax=Xanthobacter flavus TaxID=281 RepID=A0A9W6CMJ6_XANFL|nr:hypothetical protein [Xanthobacter flavus]MDR6334501.1 hypothetical protein [Xanthobacter flavus]GLI23479.1 hypothetical protein XFLAVUS301_31530 [Xanthobacter flavus]